MADNALDVANGGRPPPPPHHRRQQQQQQHQRYRHHNHHHHHHHLHGHNIVSGESGGEDHTTDDDDGFGVDTTDDDDDHNDDGDDEDIFENVENGNDQPYGNYLAEAALAAEIAIARNRKTNRNNYHNIRSATDQHDGEGIDHNNDEGQEHSEDDNPDIDVDGNNTSNNNNSNRQQQQYPEYLYDANLDDEDEAWVYRNRRSGVQETVSITQKNTSTSQQRREEQTSAEQLGKMPGPSSLLTTTTDRHQNVTNNNDKSNTATTRSHSSPSSSSSNHPNEQQQQQQQQMYRPRYSDAVLSCPCCFNIVCMDCQRHSKYPNQFRAMFVMGIRVDWNQILVYDTTMEVLVPKRRQSQVEIEVEEEEEDMILSMVDEIEDKEKFENYGTKTPSNPSGRVQQQQQQLMQTIPQLSPGEYFATLCANCETQVAALDMTDEVYHFHDCLESAAPS